MGAGRKLAGSPEYLSSLDITKLEETLAASTLTFHRALNHPAQLGCTAPGQGRGTGEGCCRAKGTSLAGARGELWGSG